MKVTRTEKIWLAAVIVLYAVFNIPGLPPYGQAVPTIIYALATIIPLWTAVYIGLVKVCRIYKLKDNEVPHKAK